MTSVGSFKPSPRIKSRWVIGKHVRCVRYIALRKWVIIRYTHVLDTIYNLIIIMYVYLSKISVPDLGCGRSCPPPCFVCQCVALEQKECVCAAPWPIMYMSVLGWFYFCTQVDRVHQPLAVLPRTPELQLLKNIVRPKYGLATLTKLDLCVMKIKKRVYIYIYIYETLL